MAHISVLLDEVIEGLALRANDRVVDATINGGGHSSAIMDRLGPDGVLVGIDADSTALDRARNKLHEAKATLHLVESNFRHLSSVLDSLELKEVDKILFDLGLSSNQLDEQESGEGRGFSFLREEPLTMTLSAEPETQTVTAFDVVNEWSEATLADILHGFAEERFARRIAQAIVTARETAPIETTTQLADTISRAIPRRFHRSRIHPATKSFQAIRIAVNDELNALTEALMAARERLADGGRVAVITFHSMEDRIVKRFFRDSQEQGFGEVLYKKPISPSPAEVLRNPRARSAKLRIFCKQVT